jgi:RimJ/RimL family protein N-acetyltransferase
MTDNLYTANGLWIYQMTGQDIPLFREYERKGAEDGFVAHQKDEDHLAQMKNPDLLYVMFMDTETSEPIGYGLLCGLESQPRIIELRRLVIFKTNRGYGRKSVQLIKSYVFSGLEAHRLWLDVRAHNERAYHLYQSEGFVDEGTLREAVLLNGQFLDVKLLSVLKREYLASGFKEGC